MNTTGVKRRSRSKINPAAKESGSSPRCNINMEQVATAAYYKAEARGFSPGRELEDWLSAEGEISKREGYSGQLPHEISP